MVSNLKTILKINYKLFSIKPILFIGYFIMILIWTVSPFITSYIIGNMFDILEKEMMRNYYFLTIVLFGINMFSIYVMKKAGIIDALISFFVSKSIKENIVKQLVKSDKNINTKEQKKDKTENQIQSSELVQNAPTSKIKSETEVSAKCTNRKGKMHQLGYGKMHQPLVQNAPTINKINNKINIYINYNNFIKEILSNNIMLDKVKLKLDINLYDFWFILMRNIM